MSRRSSCTGYVDCQRDVLRERGTTMVCVDNNAAKVKTLNETTASRSTSRGWLELVRKEQADGD